jgi:hypothetical protein
VSVVEIACPLSPPGAIHLAERDAEAATTSCSVCGRRWTDDELTALLVAEVERFEAELPGLARADAEAQRRELADVARQVLGTRLPVRLAEQLVRAWAAHCQAPPLPPAVVSEVLELAAAAVLRGEAAA